MALERWEIQLLVLLAKNKDNPRARHILSEYEDKLSDQGKGVAESILKDAKGNNRFASTASVFLERAAAHNAQRESREALQAR